MKKFNLIFISMLLISLGSNSQIIKIRKELKETFFEFNLSSTKYDVRKTLNSSDNFTEFSEISDEDYDMLDVNFKSNYKLSYLENSTKKKASFWFNKGTDMHFCFGLSIYYPSKYSENSSKQFNEIINFFKPISYKTFLEPFMVDGIKQGEMFYAYSSLKSYQNNKPYLNIMIQYLVVGNNITTPKPGKYYLVSSGFYRQSFY